MQPRYASLESLLVPLDLSNALTSRDYYVLDDHMNAAGHEKVAKLIAAELLKRGTIRRG